MEQDDNLMEQDDNATLAAASRMWKAAYALDELLGHNKATEYVSSRVVPMIELDLADCRAEVERIANMLEERLARERGTEDTPKRSK